MLTSLVRDARAVAAMGETLNASAPAKRADTATSERDIAIWLILRGGFGNSDGKSHRCVALEVPLPCLSRRKAPSQYSQIYSERVPWDRNSRTGLSFRWQRRAATTAHVRPSRA
jgi:hypothetical protein